MTVDDERIRREAHQLWEAEGRPEGRAERHWTEAKEIVALRDSFGSTLRPLAETTEDPVEPAIAFENQADMPGLNDLGESRSGPSWDNVRETAAVQPLSVEDAPAPAPSGQAGSHAGAARAGGAPAEPGRMSSASPAPRSGTAPASPSDRDMRGGDAGDPDEDHAHEFVVYESGPDSVSDLSIAAEAADHNDNEAGYDETAEGLSDIEEATRQQAEDRALGDRNDYRA